MKRYDGHRFVCAEPDCDFGTNASVKNNGLTKAMKRHQKEYPTHRCLTVPLEFGQKLWSELRKCGFRRKYVMHSDGGKLMVYMKKVSTSRELELQAWSDGLFRISSSFNGCCDTVPTMFRSVRALYKAIEKESTRTDSKFWKE